ncbi:MAG: L-threonylcarbamoyladenylate synthase [Elusimicrobia bacterium]|nr:L-threonylcarbamoyladenylate synthase [Elusimicrobiota bacterium]
MRITVPDDSLRAIETAVGILKKGGVVVIPTDTVYGLAASAFDRAAQKKIYRLKGRSYRKPLIIMPPDIPSAECLCVISADARRLMKKFWPGPLTLIVPTTPLGQMVMGGRKDAGVRIPDHPVVLKLLAGCNCPLVTTSANPSSQPSAVSAGAAKNYFFSKVDLIIDGGPSGSAAPSTVLDMTHFPYTVVREGCLPSKTLLNYLNRD